MLEKVEELFFLASSQIAGSLIKINANQNPEILVFSHEVGGGGSSCDDVIMEIYL